MVVTESPAGSGRNGDRDPVARLCGSVRVSIWPFSARCATPVEGDEMIAALPGAPMAGARVLIATRPINFRLGANSLAAMVRWVLRQDPYCGTVFVLSGPPIPTVSLRN
jgi:hypothetical protein